MENQTTFTRTQNSPGEPVFVIGEPYSGASLLTRFLSKYFGMSRAALAQLAFEYQGKLVSFGDLRNDSNLRKLISDILRHPAVESKRKQFSRDINEDLIFKRLRYRDLRGVLMAILESASISQRLIDNIHNCQSSPEVLGNLFPTAHFIYIVRDGRDIALNHFRSPNHVKNWALMALKWKHQITLMEKFAHTLPPDRFTEVRYEDLLTDPQAILERLGKSLGINLLEGQLHPLMKQQIYNDLPPDYPAMWKNDLTTQERFIFEKIAADTLHRFGYEIVKEPLALPRIYSKTEILPAVYGKEDSILEVGQFMSKNLKREQRI